MYSVPIPRCRYNVTTRSVDRRAAALTMSATESGQGVKKEGTQSTCEYMRKILTTSSRHGSRSCPGVDRRRRARRPVHRAITARRIVFFIFFFSFSPLQMVQFFIFLGLSPSPLKNLQSPFSRRRSSESVGSWAAKQHLELWADEMNLSPLPSPNKACCPRLQRTLISQPSVGLLLPLVVCAAWRDSLGRCRQHSPACYQRAPSDSCPGGVLTMKVYYAVLLKMASDTVQFTGLASEEEYRHKRDYLRVDLGRIQ